MQKFGLFDVIEKLAPVEKVVKNLFNSSAKPNVPPQNNAENIAKNPSKKKNYAPLYELMKRHDEISKRIDQNNKNKTL